MSSLPAKDGSQRWLITFADLAAVLLAFFVMMFAMAEVDTDRWEGAVDALSRRAYLQNEEALASRPQAERNVPVTNVAPGQNLSYLAALLEQQVTQLGDFDTDVLLAEDHVVISLPASAVFVGAGAELTADGRRIAFELGGLLGRMRNQVAVSTYTRNARPEELSDGLARATTLEMALRRAGLGGRVRAMVQVTGIERRAKVRMIDVVILAAGASG
jgi:chemotaxis protein MotB